MGDRIAQMIMEKIETPEVVERKDLDQTNRGQGGFGSTGMQEVKNESGLKNGKGNNELGTVSHVNRTDSDVVGDSIQNNQGRNSDSILVNQSKSKKSDFIKLKSTLGHS